MENCRSFYSSYGSPANWIQAVAVVFVESKQILLQDMIYAVEEYSFACLPVAEGGKNATEEIVSSMYKVGSVQPLFLEFHAKFRSS